MLFWHGDVVTARVTMRTFAKTKYDGVFCRRAAGLFFSLTLGVLWGSANDACANDFDGPPGSRYPGWMSSTIVYTSSTNPPGTGVLPALLVTNCESPNRAQRFLGEFGGPRIGVPTDPGYNQTRVDQTISLTLSNLPPHAALEVWFDLYILKSWDGNSPVYGPDRWSLSVAGGPTLLATTFSNNPKVGTQGSDQDYPRPHSPPRTGAASTNTLGYAFFGDSIYPLSFTFPHTGSTLTLNFSSSLFEGKGAGDESWGLDNVRISTAARSPDATQHQPPGR
jgi:hypothetical protein